MASLGMLSSFYKRGLGVKIYEPGSDVVEERLNRLYSQMKHVESRIEAGQMIPGATVPMWLTPDGLQSVDASLTYSETAEVLRGAAKWARVLSDSLDAKKHIENLDA